jgi:hypothetical protein
MTFSAANTSLKPGWKIVREGRQFRNSTVLKTRFTVRPCLLHFMPSLRTHWFCRPTNVSHLRASSWTACIANRSRARHSSITHSAGKG